LQQELRPGQYALNDFDFESPATDLTVNVSGKGTYELYDYPGEYTKRGDGDKKVRVRLQEAETPYQVGYASSVCRAFTSGYKFNMTDHYRGSQNQAYVLTSIRHSASQGGDFRSGSDDEFHYSNSFECIPTATRFRPSRTTPEPVVQGAQTAIVVGPSGEEIFTDKYGRVKVQFHWDREGKLNEHSSCWIRVAQPWAGKQWGSIYIPRVGQEVIVDFLEGDPDRPIITGRVYNAEQMPPYELPGEKTKSTFKSNSSTGGGGFNEIRFEDKKGKEQIFIHAERNKDIRIKNDLFETIGGETHLIVEKDQLEQIKGDKHQHVKGDLNEKVDGTKSLTAGQNLEEKVSQNFALDAGTEIHLKAGMNLVIESGTMLTLKVGGNFINMNPAGVFISGTMVMINSGGSAGSGAGAQPGTPKDFLRVLGQGEAAGSALVICAHGDADGFVFGEYAPGIDTSFLINGSMPAHAIAGNVHLPRRIVVSTACGTGTAPFAKAFIDGGVSAYMAPSGEPEGKDVPLFLHHLFHLGLALSHRRE